jgi:Kef-type K+ transport system membrane component KefB
MKAKKAVDPKEEESRRLHLPNFFLGYSLFVLVGILSIFMVLLLVVITSEVRREDLMLQAVMVIQLAGIGYFLPFYFLPEIISLLKYDRRRKVNLVFLIIDCASFSLFYPIFRVITLLLG